MIKTRKQVKTQG